MKMRFFSSFFLHKKAVYSQTTFVLLLILYFSLLGFSYFFYVDNSQDVSKLELEYMHQDIYSYLLPALTKTISLENQSIILEKTMMYEFSTIGLQNNSLLIQTQKEDVFLETRFKTFLPNFCNDYVIYLQDGGSLSFNGICISYSQ